MSEANKALVRRFYDEVSNQGRIEVIDQICTPDFITHSPPSGTAPNPEGMKQMVGIVRSAFPDWNITVEEMISEGNTVVARITIRGTHTGDFLGIPATGKAFAVKGMDLLHVVDGRATEVWHYEEEGALWQQSSISPS